MENLAKLVKNLQNVDHYDHPVTHFEVIETHISYVILTGNYVYKFKKPLDLEFLDFSTLEKQLFFCQEEIRLNKKMASETYIGVVKITGSIDQPELNGEGHAIAYAVKMREFPQAVIFDQLRKDNQLTPTMITQTAEILAEFHQVTARGLSDNPYGTYQQIHEPVIQNFDQIKSFLETDSDHAQLRTLSEWADHEHLRLQHIFTERKTNGFIRECHGDVHLGNIALIHEQPVIFDCIEFNDSFRWTDTMADVGFLAMDLEDKQLTSNANLFVNRYVQQTGDFAGLHVLAYYKAYRAVVRAKIALFVRMQANDPESQAIHWQSYKSCAHLAEQYCTPARPQLVITHGLTASGKTTVAEKLVANAGFIHISSDFERKRLLGLAANSQNKSDVYGGIYAPDVTEKVYEHLLNTAQVILQTGHSVIVDATFIKQHHRKQFSRLAAAENVSFNIVHTYADEKQLIAWLNARQQESNQVSEAREDIYHALKANVESLTDEESAQTLSINMTQDKDLEQKLLKLLKKSAIAA